MRAAIIDLGTNTFNLLVVDVEQEYEIVVHEKIAVKLGEGGIEKKLIAPAAFSRAIDALVKYNAMCNKLNVNQIKAFGTSAIRNAKNNFDFLKAVENTTQIKIEIIDGNREAELIYKGVKLGVELHDEKSLIMDIGGGSTEFIIANKHKIFWKQSFEIGAARLLEIIKPSNPILLSEIDNCNNYINLILEPLFIECKHHAIAELIGSSGSFDTLAEVIGFKNNNPINLSVITDYSFNMSNLYTTIQNLIATTYQERIATKGIIEIRAEMIVISSILTKNIIDNLMIEKVRLSTYALKEGVLSEMLATKQL
jgi:exopolyphosphatase/guanosine-5'-triphosphate,3'-diphosphate pyrophosphatase